MSDGPYTLMSCSVSLDGYLGDRTPRLGPRAPAVSEEDHRDEPGGPRRALELLHRRRGREARLHPEPAGGLRPRAARAGSDDRGRRPARAHARLTEDLGDRGVERLMVEGGGIVHTQLLADDLVDELHIVVAPFVVGDSNAPRFVSNGRFPWNADRRATVAEARQSGNVVLLRYALSPRFQDE
jgi:hypothetical protein